MTHLLVLVVRLEGQQIGFAMEGGWEQQEAFRSWLEGWFPNAAFAQDDLVYPIGYTVRSDRDKRETYA